MLTLEIADVAAVGTMHTIRHWSGRIFAMRAAVVSDGGTPPIALAVTSIVVVLLILTGSFEQIIALGAVLFLVYYIAAFLALFVLRHREPALPRPYRTFRDPFSTAVVLVGSAVFLCNR
jgi:basic amino acid/polyamine antiporter, APA family